MRVSNFENKECMASDNEHNYQNQKYRLLFLLGVLNKSARILYSPRNTEADLVVEKVNPAAVVQL